MSVKDPKMIAALLRERDAHERAGNKDRVDLVNKSLEFYGYKVEKKEGESSSEQSVERSRQQPPQGRSTRPTQVAKESDK